MHIPALIFSLAMSKDKRENFLVLFFSIFSFDLVSDFGGGALQRPSLKMMRVYFKTPLSKKFSVLYLRKGMRNVDLITKSLS